MKCLGYSHSCTNVPHAHSHRLLSLALGCLASLMLVGCNLTPSVPWPESHLYSLDNLDSDVDKVFGLKGRIKTPLFGKRIHVSFVDSTSKETSGFFEDINAQAKSYRIRYPRDFASDVAAKMKDVLSRVYGVTIVGSESQADASIKLTFQKYVAQVVNAEKTGDEVYPNFGGTFQAQFRADLRTVLSVDYAVSSGSRKTASGSFNGLVTRTIHRRLKSKKLYLVFYAKVDDTLIGKADIKVANVPVASVDTILKASGPFFAERSFKQTDKLLDPETGETARTIRIPPEDFSFNMRTGFAPDNPDTLPYFKVYGGGCGDMIPLIYRLADDVARATAGGLQ